MPRVLVVDDEEMIHRALKRHFELSGLEYVQALTVEEAIGHLSEPFNGIDGIFVDGMRGAGVVFVREARASGFTGPIIACSTDEYVNKAMVSAGADACIASINKDEGIDLFLDHLEKSNQESEA